MDRGRYIQVAREEALKLVEQRGDVVAVYICGSIAHGTPSEYSDVDLRVVIDTEGDLPSASFVRKRGVPLEWDYHAKKQCEDLTEILNDPFIPLELADSIILYDPDNFIRGVIGDIKSVYKQPEYVKARGQNLLEQPKRWLSMLREMIEMGDNRSQEVIYAWDLRCVITVLTKVVLILANIPPGGMKLFVSLRTAAEELQDEELFSLGLDAMGAQDITKQEVERYAAGIFKTFEYINSSIAPDGLLFYRHLSPAKKGYWQGGVHWLTNNGFHKEAVWPLITLAPVCLVEMQEARLESELSDRCVSFLQRVGLPPFGSAEEKLDLLQMWMQKTRQIIEQMA